MAVTGSSPILTVTTVSSGLTILCKPFRRIYLSLRVAFAAALMPFLLMLSADAQNGQPLDKSSGSSRLQALLQLTGQQRRSTNRCLRSLVLEISGFPK